MIDFDEDLAEVLSDDDHGVAVVHASGSTQGILNREFLEIPAGEVGISGTEPGLYVLSSFAANVSEGDTITIGGVLFTVATEPEPDGTGLSRIALNA